MTCMPVLEQTGPTNPKARLRSVDAVRGFALFAVLLVNMYNFGTDAPEWSGFLDRTFSTLMHAVFETKSLRPFSLLGPVATTAYATPLFYNPAIFLCLVVEPIQVWTS
jgi:uncharacterized membrane protein YeiB